MEVGGEGKREADRSTAESYLTEVNLEEKKTRETGDG